MAGIWCIALLTAFCVLGWLAIAGSAWVCAAVLATAGALLGRRQALRRTSQLGQLALLPDGTWLSRKGEETGKMKLHNAAVWPQAVFLTLSASPGKAAVIVTFRSAGSDAFRRLMVRLRESSADAHV